jgi:hypothetical protein
MRIFFVCLLLILFVASSSFAVSNDVILEKLNNITAQIGDLQNALKDQEVKSEQEKAVVDATIVDMRLVQGNHEVKINIIMGVLGLGIGGSGAGIYYKRKTNGAKKG